MMTRPTDDEMVIKVLKWFKEDASESEKITFKNSSMNELHDYHHTLGQRIRNEFKLWSYEWTPQLYDMVDHSPEHPDSVSFRVITKVWESFQ